MNLTEHKKFIPFGTQAKHGKIAGVGFIGGERFYLMVYEDGSQAEVKASVVEGEREERAAE